MKRVEFTKIDPINLRTYWDRQSKYGETRAIFAEWFSPMFMKPQENYFKWKPRCSEITTLKSRVNTAKFTETDIASFLCVKQQECFVQCNS